MSANLRLLHTYPGGANAQEPEQEAVVRPVVFPYVPLLQGRQCEKLEADHVPTGHSVGNEVPLGHSEPAGQAPVQVEEVSPPVAP